MKLIICLLVLVAFATGCENETLQTVDETSSAEINTGLMQLGDLPPEKAKLFQGLSISSPHSKAAITYEGQLCPGEVTSGEVALGSRFNVLSEADF